MRPYSGPAMKAVWRRASKSQGCMGSSARVLGGACRWRAAVPCVEHRLRPPRRGVIPEMDTTKGAPMVTSLCREGVQVKIIAQEFDVYDKIYRNWPVLGTLHIQ